MGRKGVEVRETSIRLVFTYEGALQRPTLMLNGKPLAPTPANVKYAHRLVAEIRDKIRHDTFVMSDYFSVVGGVGGATVADVLDTGLAAQRIEHSTKAGYTSAVKFWKAALGGDRPARSVKHSEVLKALADRPELSGKTVNNYVSVAREAFALAVVDKVLPASPFDGVPRAEWQREPPDPFTREEAEAIIGAMPEGPIRNLVEWRFFTGVRTSEAAGLQWPNVDLASGYMTVREALVRGVEKGKTKTAVARNVILNSRALAALQRQKAHTLLAGQHVWLDPRYGAPWTEERAFRRSYWTPALKRLGIRYRPPNNMRHTYATMMLMAGRTPGWCARQLGHSVEMFLRTYSRWLDGQQDDREVAGLEAWLSVPGGAAPRTEQR